MTAGPIRRTSVREVYVRRAQTAAGEGRAQDGGLPGSRDDARPRLAGVIFRGVGEGRPYPDHGLVTPKDWSTVPPRQVRLDELVTTKKTLSLDSLLSDDSTFYGDLFAHVVQHRGVMYLEDGLHRAVRAALQQRAVLHARVLVLADDATPAAPATPPTSATPAPSATPTAPAAPMTPTVPTPVVTPTTPSSAGAAGAVPAPSPATPALPTDDAPDAATTDDTPPRTAQ